MSIAEPAIIFTPWTAWNDRAELKESAPGPCLGVYLWARFESPPGEKQLPYPELPEEIIYVGETKHLEQRPLGGVGHHRLAHYLDLYPEDSNFERLYVSVFRVCRFPDGYEQPEAAKRYFLLRTFTQYVESKLYWAYAKKWGHPPALHYKKGSLGDPSHAPNS